MHARVGFATGELIQRVLVGCLAHNIEVVGPRTGKGFALSGRLDEKIQGNGNADRKNEK